MIGAYILVVFIAVIAVISITWFYEPLYCFVWDHGDYNAWKTFLGSVDDFHYAYECEGAYFYRNSTDTFEAIVWATGLCSIHEVATHKCIVCTYHECYSRKMANELLKKPKPTITKGGLLHDE